MKAQVVQVKSVEAESFVVRRQNEETLDRIALGCPEPNKPARLWFYDLRSDQQPKRSISVEQNRSWDDHSP